MPHFGWHFLRFRRILVPKLSILGYPWRPAGHQMKLKIAQVAPKMASENSRWNHYVRICSQGRFRSAPGHHFCRFRMILVWILMDLGIIFDGFRLLLCSSICRMSKPPGTKRNSGNIKNMQIAVEICKHQAQEKTNHQTPIEILQAAECR